MRVKLPYDTEPFPNFDEYYQPANFEAQDRAKKALARAKRKKNIKHVAV